MDKRLTILVMLLLATFVGMIVWVDLADALTRTPGAANSSITNKTGTTPSAPAVTSSGGTNNSSTLIDRSKKSPRAACYQQCRMGCPNGKDGGPCDNLCQSNCGGR